MFISFDGIDGTGKSTQAARLCAWLASQGHEVVTCRDPGSTPAGEAIRRLLLEERQTPLVPRTEMLLYMAARAQLVEDVIAPALEADKIVVSDRYLLANIVYQGYAGGLDVEAVRNIGRVATRGISPDLTLLLDMAPDAATSRLNRGLDRIEDRGGEYRRRLRDGFLAEAARDTQRIVVIDAAQRIDDVEDAVRAAVAPRLP